jgi:C-terminal processing protease CtpA/Prc
MKMKYCIGFLLLFCISFAQASGSYTRDENKQVIAISADIIKKQFVAKSVGELVARKLMTADFQARYGDIQSRQEFAKMFSAELRQLSADNHIGLVYSPQDVKRYRAREEAKSNLSAKKADDKNNAEALRESSQANFGIQQVRILEGDVGYLEMRYFDGFVDESAPVFASVMDLLASSKAIILDLRRNGGGNSRILPLFLGYFLGPESIHFATKNERWQHSSEKLFTRADVKGVRQFDKPLYILTSGTTFSLAEHITYHLKAFNRATVVGERTYGGGKAFDPVIVNDDFYLRIPRIEMLNTVTNDMYVEGQGITPDVLTTAQSALDKAYLLALSKLQGNAQEQESINYYQWVKRVVEAQAQPEDLDFSLPPLTGRHSFDEFEFEIRDKVLWMSFRHLPWVELINIGAGYFYDDRSIQRQFSFEQCNGQWRLQVLKPGQETVALNETFDEK